MSKRQKYFVEIFAFFVGFLVGAQIFLWIFSNYSSSIENRFIYIKSNSGDIQHKYNTILADKLFNEIKVLCLILTQPKHHKTKIQHVNNTWGFKCNKLILLSTENHSNFETFSISRNESRDILWGKVKNGFEQAYQKYFKKYDWFLKADDDSYLIMENLRQILYQHNPNTSTVIGHKYAIKNVKDGYMAGGGYILSRKALEKFTRISRNSTACRSDDKGAEDVELGKCLKENALFIDGHDEYEEKQFFPVSITDHMSFKKLDFDYWYVRNEWNNSTRGGLKCCSRNIACMHYINPAKMYTLNYLINSVHPFGLEKKYDLKFPRKLGFLELIKLADKASLSPNYVNHSIHHNFDKDEIF